MRQADVEALVDEILRETLGSVGYHYVTIKQRPDESGEDSFYVDIHFDPPPADVSSLPILQVIGDLRSRLLDVGEQRFPYVHFVLPDEEPVDDGLGTAHV